MTAPPKYVKQHKSPQEVCSSEVRSLMSLAKMIVHPNHSLGMSRATSKKRRHLLAGAIAVIHLHEILLKVLPTRAQNNNGWRSEWPFLAPKPLDF